MTTELRAAIAEDSSCVAEVLISSRKAFLPYASLAHTNAEVRQWAREVLIPGGGVTVACVDGEVVGVLAVERASDISWLTRRYIAPGYTGQGIGSALLVQALALLERPVRLYTFQANTRARSFYERYGFRAIAFGDGSANEEHCPDVLYELASSFEPEA